MTIMEQVLLLLSRSRDGLNARQIMVALPDIESLQTLRVSLSAYAKRGYVRQDGVCECAHCAHAAVCWRIADKGRERVRRIPAGEMIDA